mmetsp:Transcript_35750/g.93561  ORF Transcript_35750/g.93561 Transcript_35750/m.93561 type:complete len:246 (-) Transcript_35750:2314-3051(-)
MEPRFTGNDLGVARVRPLPSCLERVAPLFLSHAARQILTGPHHLRDDISMRAESDRQVHPNLVHLVLSPLRRLHGVLLCLQRVQRVFLQRSQGLGGDFGGHREVQGVPKQLDAALEDNLHGILLSQHNGSRNVRPERGSILGSATRGVHLVTGWVLQRLDGGCQLPFAGHHAPVQPLYVQPALVELLRPLLPLFHPSSLVGTDTLPELLQPLSEQAPRPPQLHQAGELEGEGRVVLREPGVQPRH